MKSPLQVTSEPSSFVRAHSVLIGRTDYLSILLRLIGMELYKLRRRLMSKVLISIIVIATVGLFAVIALIAFLMTNNGTSVENIRSFTAGLRLPESLEAVQLLFTLEQILIVILVSTIVGGEYTSGTIRLMLTRGPTRTQILFSKIGASLACIGLGVLAVALLGVISGLLFNFTTGIALTFDFFNALWLGHALLYFLIIMLGLFTYAMMALCLSNLGRATAAGLAGVLTWSFVIEPVLEVISPLGRIISGPFGSLLQALPNYLISSNISVLIQNQSQYIFPSTPGLQTPSQSDLHALLVLAVYLIVFIGLAWWMSIRRNIIN